MCLCPVHAQSFHKRRQQSGSMRAFYGVPHLLITASPAAAEAWEDPSAHRKVSGRRGGMHAHGDHPAIYSDKDVMIRPILQLEKQRLRSHVT